MAILMPSSLMDGMAKAVERNGFDRKAKCEVAVPKKPAELLGYLCNIEGAKRLHYSTFEQVTTRCLSTLSLYIFSARLIHTHSPISAGCHMVACQGPQCGG